MSQINYDETIPNNVNLSEDKRLKRAMDRWHPEFLNWWDEVGPQINKEDDVYLRTAISTESGGWANYGHVKMRDYRWGIFLAHPEKDRVIPHGDDAGKPVWQEVPGAHRHALRRLIVVQADTEPASVEQQKWLAATAPSLYDCRNLFQVNVEEARHLWAMVYLLQAYFGRDGRDEADDLLARRSGDVDQPRLLNAFNQPCNDWLSFFFFTAFTDRDGKYQLGALAESAFDPLSRSCRFMLTEEAHHLFVGETGIGRIIRRTAQLMKQDPNEDARAQGGIDLPTLQKFCNFWYANCQDLFGAEISTNAADYFAAGLKGRFKEATKYKEHSLLHEKRTMHTVEGDKIVEKEVPLRNAINDVLREDYSNDCIKVVGRWNRILKEEEIDFELTLPSTRFFRQQGLYMNHHFSPDGTLLTKEEWETKKDKWLPSQEDQAYVESLMVSPVTEPGAYANWIAPPAKGINGQESSFRYIHTEAN